MRSGDTTRAAAQIDRQVLTNCRRRGVVLHGHGGVASAAQSVVTGDSEHDDVRAQVAASERVGRNAADGDATYCCAAAVHIGRRDADRAAAVEHGSVGLADGVGQVSVGHGHYGGAGGRAGVVVGDSEGDGIGPDVGGSERVGRDRAAGDAAVVGAAAVHLCTADAGVSAAVEVDGDGLADGAGVGHVRHCHGGGAGGRAPAIVSGGKGNGVGPYVGAGEGAGQNGQRCNAAVVAAAVVDLG